MPDTTLKRLVPSVRTSSGWSETQKGGDIVFTIGNRWIRAAAYCGEPPGSHIGLWRTKWGPLQGLNLRIGRRYRGPCLTLFVHTRRRGEA